MLETTVKRYPLHSAAAMGGLEVVRYLLDVGLSCNAPDGSGMRPLHVTNRAEVVRILLEVKADPNKENNDGERPLETVKDIEAARVLLEAKAKVDQNWTLDEAARKGKLGVILALAKKREAKGFTGKELYRSDSRESSEMCPLGWAAFQNHLEIVKFFLDEKVDPNQKASGRAVLHHACQQGHTRIVKLLLASGADPTVKTSSGWTPFRYTHKIRVKEILGEQLKLTGKLTIFQAAALGWDEDIKSIVAAGSKSVVNMSDEFGQTPLHHAASQGRHVTASLLLGLNADPNIRDRYGVRPLEGTEDFLTAKSLLEKKAMVDTGEWTLYTATREKKIGVIVALLNARANPLEGSAEDVGHSPLAYAAVIGAAEATRAMLNAPLLSKDGQAVGIDAYNQSPIGSIKHGNQSFRHGFGAQHVPSPRTPRLNISNKAVTATTPAPNATGTGGGAPNTGGATNTTRAAADLASLQSISSLASSGLSTRRRRNTAWNRSELKAILKQAFEHRNGDWLRITRMITKKIKALPAMERELSVSTSSKSDIRSFHPNQSKLTSSNSHIGSVKSPQSSLTAIIKTPTSSVSNLPSPLHLQSEPSPRHSPRSVLPKTAPRNLDEKTNNVPQLSGKEGSPVWWGGYQMSEPDLLGDNKGGSMSPRDNRCITRTNVISPTQRKLQRRKHVLSIDLTEKDDESDDSSGPEYDINP
eukprot:CAMPEP_0184492556 /NCGR_PEP_ID=MMETSP0113_2-20130426/23626_1 /TAXON_ID=91329 /ORGANISM="Norrisiella sphaerica, Strain BC52" /LENGTH=698 /DNA_ID=CAMNT_0026877421 /DNA_START=1 /DNA_END=2097 /DNA_ORIENTATION=-